MIFLIFMTGPISGFEPPNAGRTMDDSMHTLMSPSSRTSYPIAPPIPVTLSIIVTTVSHIVSSLPVGLHLPSQGL